MQAQQLYNELRRVKHELEQQAEEKEDLREELREMTQLYLKTKQERDKCKHQIDSVRNDLTNIDKIIKDAVEKAIKSKEKQIQELINRVKEQQEKLAETEEHKTCYLERIQYLEDQLKINQEELKKEREGQQITENTGKAYPNGLYDEKMRLKQLMMEDQEFRHARQKEMDELENQNFGISVDKDVTSTHEDIDDDFSLGDPSNKRLQEDTESSDVLHKQGQILGPNEIQVELVGKKAKRTQQKVVMSPIAKVHPHIKRLNMQSKKQEGVHLRDQEETKISGGRKQTADFMLSQDSIKQYEHEAEIETKEEREKLQALEKQRREFAKMLKEKSDVEFKKKQDQTKADRLKYLLKQTEIFSHFILQKPKGQVDDNQMKLAITVDKKKDQCGKSSVSKRHAKKAVKPPEDDAEASDDQVLTRLNAQPAILKDGTLRDYQLDGLNWLIGLYETGINGILADEMGLGKTIQTISLLAFLREYKHVKGYHLVIVPKSTLPNWMKEFKKWCPSIKVVNLIAKKEQREEILKNDLLPGKFDVVLTTFEGCRICLSQLQKFKWEYLIVDEAHKIKNEESQISQKLRTLDSRFRLLLTGTPLQNNLHELWSLLNFLLPEVFTSAEDFDEWFDLSGSKTAELSDKEKEQRNTEIVQQLHKILRPFMLRRIKKEVEKSLKPKVEVHVNVGITEQQKSIYRQLLKKSTIEKGTSVSFFRNIIIQLRKICDHPYLFEGQEPEGAEEFGEHIITSCGKMIFLDKLLKKVFADKNQALIFSGFTSMLDILEDYCLYRKYNYCRLDGNTELDDREKYIEEFTKPGSEKFIFLISTRAGGLGLNLMTANIVVLYDSDWNPQIDLQAMDRAHRIGQKKIVQVFRLITNNTMEEKMIEKQTMKLKLDNLIIQKGRLAPKHSGFQKEELQDMVNYGADAIFQIGSNLQDEDIEEMIRKGEEKANSIQKKAEEIVKDKFNMLDFQMNSVNMREKKMAQMNLNESKLFPKFFQGGNIGISNDTKKKKLMKVQDFRFFPNAERLKVLLEKELDAKYTGYLQGIEQVVFTEEEKKEKNDLWSQGFFNWDRRDYQRFCQALELYAKDDYENIAEHIGTKNPEEIKEYSQVFFDKLETLNDAEKIKKNIVKAEKTLSFKQKAPEIIKTKVMAYENPLDEMVIYSTQKSKYFSKESDIILLCLTHKYGYGKWKDIKRGIRRDSRCRFDHLFLSRNEQELSRRVDILVRALEKEGEQQSKKKESAGDMEQDNEEMMDDFMAEEESTDLKKDQKKRMVEKEDTISESEEQSAQIKDEEESKFDHLKDEAEIRVGGGRGMTYADEEEEKVKTTDDSSKAEKSKKSSKKQQNGKQAKNTMDPKQTKLSFGNFPKKICGFKREAPEEEREDLESGLKKQKQSDE